MSALTVYSEHDSSRFETYTRFEAIARCLEEIGVRLEQWEAQAPLTAKAPQEEIIGAYQSSVDRLCQEYGFKSVDVISITPDQPEKKALREKFLSEHTHGDFEVRFFVEGQGQFYLHAQGKVYALLCGQGDLISVPAGLRHWFDMGATPNLKCIRLFTTPEGWVADFTGDSIAERFPRLVSEQ